MAFITGAIAWLTANWAQLAAILGLLLTAGAAIARFTPTPKDDAIFAKMLAWLNLLPVTAKKIHEEKASKPKIAPVMKDK